MLAPDKEGSHFCPAPASAPGRGFIPETELEEMEENHTMLELRKGVRRFAAVLAVLAVVPLWGNQVLAGEQRIENGTLIVTGNGIPPEKGSVAQKRLMAKRAAQADAYRLVGEYIQGVQVDSQTTVKDFVAQSDDIKTKVSALVKGALVIATRNMSDGSVEVDLAVKLDDVYAAMPPAVKVDPPPPEPLVAEPPPPAKEPTSFPMDIHIKRRQWNEEALAHNEKGIDLATKGDLDGAMGEYQQAANMDPNMDIAWSNMAEVYISKKDFTNAVSAAQKAVTIDGSWSDNQYRLGVALWVSGDKDGAIAAENKALAIKIDNDWALGALGEMYAAVNQNDKALAQMQKATKSKPEDPQLWYYLGFIQSELKDTDNAKVSLSNAVDKATKMGIDYWEAKDKLSKL